MNNKNVMMGRFVLALLVAMLCGMPMKLVGQVVNYSCGFEDSVENSQWVMVNGNSVNQWMIGEGARATGEKGLYISMNGNGVNGYDGDSETWVYAYRELELEQGIYEYSYQWRCYGERWSDYLRVALAPATDSLTGGVNVGFGSSEVPAGWIALDGGSKLNMQSNWTLDSGEVFVPQAGSYRLVFFWCNNPINAGTPPAGIDDIEFALPSCPTPVCVRLMGWWHNSLTVGWHEVGSASQWEVECVPVGMEPGMGIGYSQLVNDTVARFENLPSNVAYDFYVRSVCGMEYSNWASVTLRTACSEITMPYFENFDEMEFNEIPECWYPVGSGCRLNEQEWGSTSENKFLVMTGGMIFTPHIPLAGNEMAVRVAVYNGGENEGIVIGFCDSIMADPNVVWVDTLMGEARYEKFLHEVDFGGIESTHEGYVAFKPLTTGRHSYAYIDELNIYQRSDCENPIHVQVSNIRYDQARVMWHEVEAVDSYEVSYGLVNNPDDANMTLIPVTEGNRLDLYDLESDTTYYVWVRSVCNGGYSAWSERRVFRTPMSCSSLKNIQTTVGHDAIGFSWQYDEVMGAPTTGVEISWKLCSEDSYQTMVVMDSTYAFVTGLLTGMWYDIKVRAVCDNQVSNVYSDRVKMEAFTKRWGNLYPTVATNNIPVSGNGYSYSQILYKDNALNGLDTIVGIGFDVYIGFDIYSDSVAMPHTWDIYMGNVSQSTLTQSTYVSLDSLTLVGSGVIFDPKMNDWTVPLMVPFVREAGKNLVVAIDDNTYDTITNMIFGADRGISLISNATSTDINPANPTNMVALTYAPVMNFITPTHGYYDRVPVAALKSIGSDSAQFVWVSDGDLISYRAKYKKKSIHNWAITPWVTGDTTMTVSGLEPGTMYDFKVERSSQFYGALGCDLYGKTTCNSEAIPFVENFHHSSLPTCWTYGNKLSIYRGYPEISRLRLSLPERHSYAITPMIDCQMSEMHVMFNMYSLDAGLRLVLAVGDDPMDLNSFVTIDTIRTNSANVSEIKECSLYEYDGTGQYVGLFALDDDIYVDEFLIEEAPACAYPSNLMVTDVTDTSARISWSGNITNTSSWTVAYGISGLESKREVEVSVDYNSYEIRNLVPNRSYEVLVLNNCSNDTMEALLPITFRTLCGDLHLPYEETFEYEQLSEYHHCWFKVDEGAARMPMVERYNAEHGHCMRFGGNANMILPYVSVPAQNLYMRFDAKSMNVEESGDIAVGFSKTTMSLDSVVYVDTIHFVDTEWGNYEVKFESLDTSMGHIVFKNINSNTIQSLDCYIDNVLVMDDYGCDTVSDIKVGLIVDNSAELSFKDALHTGNYTIGYSSVHDISNMDYVVDYQDTVFLFDELMPSTRYYVWIRNNCEQGHSIWKEGPSFVTVCPSMDLPYEEDFDSYTEDVASSFIAPITYPMHKMPDCWSFINMSGDKNEKPQAFMMKSNNAYVVFADSAAALVMYADTAKPLYAVMPEMLYGVQDLEVSFMYRTNTMLAEEASLTLGVMTNIADTSTFRAIQEYPKVEQMTRVTHSFRNDRLDVDSVYTIVFKCGTGSLRSRMSIDGIVVRQADMCSSPEFLSVDKIYSNSAVVKWHGLATSYEVEYRSGDENWVDMPMTTDTMITLTGLQSACEYSVRVRSKCNEYESEWSPELILTTLCDAENIPYRESFDSYTHVSNMDVPPSGYPDIELPTCWEFPLEVSDRYQTPWIFLSKKREYCGNGNSLFFVSNATTATYAVLPLLNAQLNTLKIRFAYRNEDTNVASAPLELGVMTNVLDMNSFRLLESLPLVDSMTMVEHSFAQDGVFASDSNYFIAFRYGGNGSEAKSMSIDNVEVSDINNVLCEVPSMLSVDDIEYVKVLLKWQGTSFLYDVEYREVGDTEWRCRTVAQNECKLTGLNPGINYEWRVRANCGGSVGYSDWVTSVFMTKTCPMVDGLTVDRDGSVIIVDWTTSAEQRNYHVCVMNADNEVLQQKYTGIAPVEFRGLPEGARYFVKIREMCEHNVYGDWSDSVLIEIPTCGLVANIDVVSLDEHSVKVTWTSAEDVNQWEVEYGLKGYLDGFGTKVKVDSREYVINDLSEHVDYDLRIRSICGTELYSLWSSRVKFDTETGMEGVDGIQGDYMFVVYPNPTNGNTTIRLQGVEGRVDLSVVDMNGRIVMRDRLECGVDCEKRFDVTGLAKGTYYVRVVGEQINSVRKLVVW